MSIKRQFVLVDDSTGDEITRSESLIELFEYKREHEIVGDGVVDMPLAKAEKVSGKKYQMLKERAQRVRATKNRRIERERREKTGKPAK